MTARWVKPVAPKRGDGAKQTVASLRRWAPPLALAIGALVCTGSGVVLAAAEPSQAAGGGDASLTTPVLSPRRVPTVIAAPVAERRLRDALDSWIAELPAESCVAVTAPDGRILHEHRGRDPLVPASAQKLLVATAALVLMGPDATFETTAVAPQAPADGVLAGDLVVIGGGDPGLSTSGYLARYRRPRVATTDLAELADALVAAGVHRIDGAVVGDEGRYDGARQVASWPPRYATQDVAGPLSALLVNDGWVEYPTDPGTGGDLVPAADPAEAAAAALTRLLEERGVAVAEPPRSGPAPEQHAVLARLRSAPLTEILTDLLAESDNETAELLLKELGLRHGTGASTAGGASAVTEVLAGAGFDLADVRVVDGSGLALENRVTCQLLVDLLRHPDTGPTVVAGLARAGESGTLARRYDATDLVGVLAAKTGTLNTVTALAGTVTDDDGVLTFAHLANVAAPARVGPVTIGAQDDLVRILRDHPRRPDIDRLSPLPVSSGEGA